MKIVTTSLDLLRSLCLFVAILATILLFAVVAINVIGRTIFDVTGGSVNMMIFGAIELSQYALMVSIFAAIPAMLGTGLIRVDILSNSFPRWLQSALDRVWLILIAAFAAVLCVAFFEFAHTAFERGDQTQDLRGPLWPFYGVASLECAALTLLAIAEALGLTSMSESDS